MRAGDLIANRFEIAGQAGAGGMGVIYRAIDRETGAPVAVKLLSEDVARDAKRFDQEASLLASFNHPAIVHYVAHGQSMRGTHYLVMEWVDGQTLNQRLEREGLSLAEAVETIARVSDGVAFAHRMGVVHRDIKPSNILFPDGEVSRVKIIDFGIALRTQVAVRFTESGTVLGTPSYMAPEQARASRQVDARTDVFALGCVLFECLTGTIAFAGSNPLAVRAKALVMSPPLCSELVRHVPPVLDHLVARMLAKEPDDRPAHAGIVATELAALGSLPSTQRIRRSADDVKTQRIGVGNRLAGGRSDSERPLIAVILAAIPEDYAHLSRPESPLAVQTRAQLEKIAAPYGARIELLADRSSMIVMTGQGSANQQAAAAAHCALMVRTHAPQLALVLTVGDDDGLFDAIDRGARTMDVAVRRAILDRGLGPGPAVAGAIRIDPIAANMLGSQFRITRAGSKTYYLDGYQATTNE